MKRQKIRKGIVFISFFLFPITFYYFSPVLILQGASEGVISGSFVMFGLMFLVSLVLGRGFCGWVCPVGGLQECCMMASDKRAKGKKLNLLKYFIWVPWILLIIYMGVSAGGFRKIDPLYMTFYGISVSDIYSLVIYYMVSTVIVILVLAAGRRSFCRYICWMAPFMVIGTKIKDLLKYPSLHLEPDADKCINCKLCTKKCPMSLDVDRMVAKRDMKNPECILCGECMDACPKKVIKYSMRSKVG